MFSNADGSVICQTTQLDTTHETLCVSDKARAAQPECNPKDILIPAIAIQDKFVNLKCWNQGFEQPERLSPFQVRRHGSATIIPGFSGSLYVFDSARFALIRAGERNAVIFGKR